MLVGKVLRRELLSMDLVHGRAGVGDRTHFIGVELLPPVERGREVHIHRDHPTELAVDRAGLGQTQHQVKVIGPDDKLNRYFKEVDGQMVQIEKAEFDERKAKRVEKKG